jgi:DNA-binding transcriptional ArsR family regulator
MQGARPLVLLAVLVLLPAADAVQLSFETPAQARPLLHASHGQWVLLLFHETPAAASLRTSGEGAYTNFTWVWQQDSYLAQLASLPYDDEVRQESSRLPAGLVETLGFGDGWGSLYVEADSISLNLTAAEGRISIQNEGDAASGFMPAGYERSAVRPAVYRVASAGAIVGFRPLADEGVGFTLKATGLRVVEWHGAAARCLGDASPCPEGGGSTKIPLFLPTGDSQNTTLEYYSTVEAPGYLEANGTAVLGAVGGAGLGLEVVGQVRFPLARLAAPCAGCADPGGRTLAANGTTVLEGLAPQPGSRIRMEASVEGLGTVRLDEVRVPFSEVAVPAAAAGAALLAAVFAVRWIAALFSRQLDPEGALALPARREVYEAIQAHPGVMYGFLMRETGQADGAVRHHLKVLEKVGLIVRERHRGTVRFFENHGRYRHNWRHVAVLRDDELRRLLDWLKDNPGQPQQAVVRHAGEAWGLTRAATQRRLARLVDWGLVQSQAEGRRLTYTVRLPQDEAPAQGSG